MRPIKVCWNILFEKKYDILVWGGGGTGTDAVTPLTPRIRRVKIFMAGFNRFYREY